MQEIRHGQIFKKKKIRKDILVDFKIHYKGTYFGIGIEIGG